MLPSDFTGDGSWDTNRLEALISNVPGAIYRSAWHDNHKLALISDEIERISGYPPANFIASAIRSLTAAIAAVLRGRVATNGVRP